MPHHFSPFLRRAHPWIVLTVGGLLVGGCEGPTEPAWDVEELVVTPNPAYLGPGDNLQLAVSAVDGNGNLVTGVPVTFSSSDADLITVSKTGLVHAVGPTGSAVVTVSGGDVTAEVQVAVYGPFAQSTGLNGRPYAAAISPTGVVYIGLLDVAQLARADLPGTTFAPAVSVGNIPTEVAFNSSGTRAYATNQWDQDVSVVDVATNSEIDRIAVTGAPFEVIVTPGDSILYVTTNADSVYGIRLASKAVVARFKTPNTANGLAVRDTMLYVSTWRGGTVIEFNLRTRAIARVFRVGGIPQKLAFSPNGQELYIANQDGYVQFWNLVSGIQIGTPVTLPGGGAYGIDRSPSTGLLYVSTAYFGGGNLHVVDPTTRQVLKTFKVGGAARRVVFHSSGLGLVSNEGGWVDFVR